MDLHQAVNQGVVPTDNRLSSSKGRQCYSKKGRQNDSEMLLIIGFLQSFSPWQWQRLQEQYWGRGEGGKDLFLIALLNKMKKKKSKAPTCIVAADRQQQMDSLQTFPDLALRK